MADDEIACRRVILIRHGHYERTGGLGDTAWGLSPLGRRQAVRVGKRVAQLVTSSTARFEGLYASPWPRAAQTAEIAARELELASVKIKPYLHEVIPVVDPARVDFGTLPLGLETTPPHERQAAHEQVEKVRDRFFRPPRRAALVLLFTHGNLIRYLVSRTLRLPYEAWAMMDIAHCGITELRVYGSGFEALVSFNETGHLPPPIITTA
ncbi:MAG: histidine phosphatase family protein [Nannocystaceae bacterium]|nr:histidine phosphatase family protein [Nannocystaceae bacterium]